MEVEVDGEQKPVDCPPSETRDETGKKRGREDDCDVEANEKRPRLEEDQKVDMENEVKEEVSIDSDVKPKVDVEADCETESVPKIEDEVASPPEEKTEKKATDVSSNKSDSEPEEKEDGEKEAVMKNAQSDQEEKMELADSASSEVKQEVEEDDKEKVGSSKDPDTASSQSGSETIPNGGVGLPNGLDDRSTVKSDDSEKENQGRETPMDLTQKPPGASDIITLSDESEDEADHFPVTNGFREMSAEEQFTRNRMVKRLQGELRNEEAKLVLLKKLRHSQMTTHQLPEQGTANSINKQSHSSSTSHRQNAGPPPLVRGSNQQQQQVKISSHLNHSQSIRGQHLSQSSRSQMHGPPPLVMAPRAGSNSSSNSHLLQQQQQQHSQNSQRNMLQHMYGGMQPAQAHQAATPVPPQQDTQTPAQRQAAAKLALRKQLEKTLLQIPPPKPPPPEMNFIPSLACPDFILLLGLEEVVNYIIDAQLIAKGEKNADEKFVCNPFTCVQCHSDYTPVWKREKPGSKNVICEQCVTSNQKKALKQEHTNRLKSAFVKALQQEQEIERMQAQSLTQTPPAITSTPPLASVAAPAPSLLPSVAAQYKPSPEQLRQHQNFLQQAHQAQLQRVAGQQMGMNPFGARGHYSPYQIPYTKQNEIQRQYLLDMIPRGSMPGWKS